MFIICRYNYDVYARGIPDIGEKGKNERMKEKKTFGEKLRIILDKLGTMVLMNLLFLIAALPIVTIGPAWNALLTANRYKIRGDKWLNGFKFGFKTRFWRSLLSWCIFLAPLYYFVAEINYHWQSEQLVPLVAAAFVFALLAMFLISLTEPVVALT